MALGVLLDPFPALPERTILARGGRTFAASFVLPGSVFAVAAAEVDDDDPVAFDLPMSSIGVGLAVTFARREERTAMQASSLRVHVDSLWRGGKRVSALSCG